MLKKTKLVQLLETFSADEFTDFGKFINSPFHNESPKMRTLYTFLKKYYPAFDHKDCTKENIFSTLYSNDMKYDDAKLRERFSDMLKLCEDYLAYLHFKKNPVEFKRQSLLELSGRNLEVHFDKKYKEITAILDRTKVKDVFYFLDVFNIVDCKSNFYEFKMLMGKRKHVCDEMADETDTFLIHFAVYMTALYVTMYNMASNRDYNFEFKFYEPVMKFIEENNLTAYPLVKANCQILKIMENENDENLYYALKKTFINSLEEFSEADKMRISTLLVNDALKRFMKGQTKFNIERFEILKLQLEYEIYTKENKWLSRELYFNYVQTAVSLGEVSWAENFIENYTVKLGPDRRKHAYMYTKGSICFHKKEYTSALKLLSGIKGGDYLYFLMIKALTTKIYYEMGDYEKVFSVLDSFKHYLSSNAIIPAPRKKRYTNYIRILNKLTLLKFKNDEFETAKLIVEIKNYSMSDLTVGKDWLLEKAMELKASSH